MKKEIDISSKFSKKIKLKKGDKVKVITGKYKGRDGKILEINRVKENLTVEGINIQKKTLKKSQENPNGGIIEREAPIHVSNVMYLEGDKPTRIGIKVDDGKKVRFSKRTGVILS